MGKALITINGVAIPTPSTYVGTESTVVDSARNTQGVVVGTVVRESVCKVEATWRYLTAQQWSNILKLFNSRYGGSFYNYVEFFNQVSNTWETRQMYVSDRTSAGAFTLNDDGSIEGYEEPKLSLVEV